VEATLTEPSTHVTVSGTENVFDPAGSAASVTAQRPSQVAQEATMTSRRHLFTATGLAAGGALLAGGTAAIAEAATTGAPAAATDPWTTVVPGILAGIKPPTFPPKTFPITSYGAKGDGTTDNTAAFAKAIKACNAAGGGRVTVPAGRWLTGAIELLDNVNLNVASGATILFSTNPSRYPVVLTRWQGIECMNFSPLIHAEGRRNIAVTGAGTLDGQGQAWKSFGGGGSDWTNLQKQGANGTPVSKRVYGPGHHLRPAMIEPRNCQNILIDGVTILRPPMWAIHPVLSSNITVSHVKLHTRGGGGNNDGCDPECCSDVHIVGNTFDTGDDCIAIKSGRDVDAHRVNVPSKNIVIENNDFVFSNRGAICIGSEVGGGANNIYAQNCRVNPANRSGQLWYLLFVKTGNKRGGTIEQIHLRNITGNKLTKSALYVTMTYGNSGPGPTMNPTLRNIFADNITVNGAGDYGLEVIGLSASHARHIHVTHAHFSGLGKGTLHKTNADDVTVTK
jgi:polygalacturonase